MLSLARRSLVALSLCSVACSAGSADDERSLAESVDAPDAAYCEEPGRFTDASGIVVDHRASDAGLVEWQKSVSAGTYPQPDAVAYCAALDLEGSGWRLPSVNELATLLLHPIGLGASPDPTCEPSIDQVAFPHTPATDFWTSTTHPSLGDAYYTGFDDGRSHPADPTTPMSVRCIRTRGSAT
jgi:hypothetical protein